MPVTCEVCHGSRVVSVIVCEETQMRTCVSCPRPIVETGEALDLSRFRPLACPEPGTAAEYRLGVRDSQGGRAW